MDTLDHDCDLIEGQRDDEFRCLVYASDPKIDNQRVAFHCYEDLRRYHAPSSEQISDKSVLARFVPLGCLRKSSLEAGEDPTLKHITNHVVLWNTSTKPHSRWICYDYYRPDFDGCGRRRKLGKPTYYNAEEDDEFGPQGCAFPLEENTDPDEEIPGGRDVVLYYYGYDDPYENEPDDHELVRPLPAKSPLPLANDTPGESQTRNPGYFNTDKPLISPYLPWISRNGMENPASTLLRCPIVFGFCAFVGEMRYKLDRGSRLSDSHRAKDDSNKEDAIVADELGMRGRRKQCPFDMFSCIDRKHARLMDGMPVGCRVYRLCDR